MRVLQSELTWNDVDRLSAALAQGLPAAVGVDSFDRVVGVSRGGLIPAVLIASHLRVKRIETVQVRLYDGDTRLASPRLFGSPPEAAGPRGDPARTLVVDEIFDSGRTMEFLRAMLPHATFAVLVARETGRSALRRSGSLCAYAATGGGDDVIWAAEGVATDEWILFPWSPPEDRAARDGES
jgi:xanthine phosphoribosyltransferase